MSKPHTATNIIKCRYCPYWTQRFRGKKHGERNLRVHVLERHLDQYKSSLGLEDFELGTTFALDVDERSENFLS